MTAEIYVNQEHKPNAAVTTWDASLVSIWSEDSKRNWSVYSKEQFRRFWDRHIAESRKK